MQPWDKATAKIFKLKISAAFLFNLVGVNGNRGVATYRHMLFVKVEIKNELISQSKKIYFIILQLLL